MCARLPQLVAVQVHPQRAGDIVKDRALYEVVTLNDRQDYFGQTVNIASRVQNLATSQSIFATNRVVEDGDASDLLEVSGLAPKPHRAVLRGIAHEMNVYEIP